MYIEKIKIDKFRVLEDIEIRFQTPNSATADPETGNVVNVIAGVNGTGKTSILESVFRASHLIHGLPDVNSDKLSLDRENTSFNLDKGIESDATKTIFLPAKQGMSYQPVLKLPMIPFAKIDSEAILGNAEFYIKEYVVSREREIYISDPEVRSKESVNIFNAIFDELGLLTRLHNLDKNQFNRPIFIGANNNFTTIENLSDGEKQVYGRVVALMMLGLSNSIILIDEPEIALHPAWQQKIIKVYSRIGKNNQFIIATHSPQIIASVPYQHLIILKKENGKIVSHYPDQPPIGADVNSILDDFMGVKSEFPDKVVELHKSYREKVEQGLEKTEEAEKIRTDLLQYESNDSRFMQEMRILMRLRGKK